MSPLVFACWKWKPSKGYRTTFTAEHVRILRNMLARHYHGEHRFVCITDDPKGLDDIDTIPLWDQWANVPSRHGTSYPSCYRRLKLFAPYAHELLGVEPGSRVVSIDLDMVITRDITPLFDRPEDIVLWGESDYKSQWYNGSLWMLKLGTRPKVYTAFDPKRSPSIAYQSGGRGSDQGWFTHILRPREATWGRSDGVYSYRKHISPPYGSGMLPDDARVVVFHGKLKQDAKELAGVEWLREHYR